MVGQNWSTKEGDYVEFGSRNQHGMGGKVGGRRGRKRKQLKGNIDLQGSLFDLRAQSYIKLAARRLRDQCRTPAVVVGSPAPGSAKADGIFLASDRTGSGVTMVNQVGHSEPAWEQLGEAEAGEMRKGLYQQNNS